MRIRARLPREGRRTKVMEVIEVHDYALMQTTKRPAVCVTATDGDIILTTWRHTSSIVIEQAPS